MKSNPQNPEPPESHHVFQGLRVPTGEVRGDGPDPNGFFLALQRLHQLGLPVSSVIDVGASDGQWIRPVLRQFPDARTHLIEVNAHHQTGLEQLAAETPGMSFSAAAASDEVGTLKFYRPPEDAFGGRSMKGVQTPPHLQPDVIEVPATTIDAEVAREQLPGPYAIKLDTHGHELAILEGARRTLAHTSVLFLELYNMKIGGDCLLFWEMCHWLEERGFRLWDLFDPIRRDGDGMLWQFDGIFLRKDFPAFSNNSPCG